MQRSWGVIWFVVIVIIGGALWYISRSPGSLPQPESFQPPSKPLNPEDYPKLQESLVGLVEAADPAAFAKEHGFAEDFKDGLVRVTIEMKSRDYRDEICWAIEALDGKLGSDYENLQDAYLPPLALLKLAKHPHIEYIRLPVRAKPD